MNKREFILNTLIGYKNDPTTCAIENGFCRYLTQDGHKCAVGKHLKEGPWQNELNMGIRELIKKYEEDIFTDEAKEQNLSISEWNTMQLYHDTISTSLELPNIFSINNHVKRLEILTGLEFPELYFK